MLNESRLYNFLSKDKQMSLQFLEGQKLIHDLALIHGVKTKGFAFFRDTVLSIQPMMYLLKKGDTFGVYVDSEEPYFRFKVEMSRGGQMRTLMLPHDFDQNPKNITGVLRLAKTSPGQQVPYTSIVELRNVKPKNLANIVLEKSYQVQGEVFISDTSDQSILLMNLPSENDKIKNIREEWMKIQKEINEIFSKSHNNSEEIIKSFEELGFDHLDNQEVKFNCNCSLDRMLQGIRNLASGDLESVFHNQSEIEINCDYCLKKYKITRMMLAH